jgi:putative transposase
MRDNGLKVLQKRRFKKTTDSDHSGPVASNLLDQDFFADGPDQKWAADISYIWTAEGWLYLAVVVGLFSRRIVGWATNDRMKKDLALIALKRALVIRQPAAGIIHHSDRGSQYCSGDYRQLLAGHKIFASMSGKTIKSELIWRTIWQSRSQAEIAIGRYIDGLKP